MGQITVELLWVGSFRATAEETEELHKKVAEYANQLELGHLLTKPIITGTNGLTQFALMPTGSKDGWPTSNNWESLAASMARLCAGTTFSVKRLYVASN